MSLDLSSRSPIVNLSYRLSWTSAIWFKLARTICLKNIILSKLCHFIGNKTISIKETIFNMIVKTFFRYKVVIEGDELVHDSIMCWLEQNDIVSKWYFDVILYHKSNPVYEGIKEIHVHFLKKEDAVMFKLSFDATEAYDVE
jgi:hypothetical protein